MTKREAAIVSAYTGYLIGEYSELQKYVSEVMEEASWDKRFPNMDYIDRVKAMTKDDFLNIKIEWWGND